MATRPLPEPVDFRFAPYIDELHEFFATSGVPFGSPEDLTPIVARALEPGTFADDLSSLVRSFILRQGGAMPHAQLMEILSLAIGGQQLADAPQQYREPLRQLLGFVSGILRRPWNSPPGEPAEVLPFPVEPSARTSEAADRDEEPRDDATESVVEASTPPLIPDDPLPPQTPSDPIPAPAPSPIPPAMPVFVPPLSAISAALAAESERSAQPNLESPATLIHRADPRPAQFESDKQRPPVEGVRDHASEPWRPASISSRNILIATAAALVLCAVLVFAYSTRKSGGPFVVAPYTPSQTSHQTASQTSTPDQASPAPAAAPAVPSANGTANPSKPSAYGPPLTARQLRHSPHPAPGAPSPDIAEPYSSSPRYAPGGSDHTSVPNQAPVQANPAGAVSSAPQQTTAFSTYSPYNPGANARPNSSTTSATPTQPPAPIVREQIPQPPLQPTFHDPDASYVGELPAGTQYRATPMVRPSSFTVSSGVMAANLISSPEPEYPMLARLAHIEGQVILQAIVAKDGTVSNTRVLRGNRLLRGAAQDAVRRWRYHPYRVNGRPVDVATIVTVDFHN